ncbi:MULTISPECIES: DUF1287 domain-containing protein [unclassified Pseudoxanthomonas]|uniref:DUF1287 domain-containing protein n=1 Tax=unclassified Pseudoxanthomonas TaxID=2645906 RepID=UPI000B85DDC1|nr:MULTISPECIES: DUF1287 domain-containing protein [unclassified Pseudoxanthomonas]PPJ44042.1 DUF1287 domain-containing protein [Pseudoxanthomonas sp. KAs_5_3]
MLLTLAACRDEAPVETEPEAPPAAAAHTPSAISPPLVAAARMQIGVVRLYDPAYFSLPYPGGDVPADRGVCTDVVIRALRTQGLDLQQAIHEDMRAHFDKYPRQWGLSRTDRNIDHRRVPNQMRWFERHGWKQSAGQSASDFAAGDIVAWRLSGSGLLHIGIVSDRRSHEGTPLILHNINAGTREDDILFHHAIIGHYRQPTDLASGASR